MQRSRRVCRLIPQCTGFPQLTLLLERDCHGDSSPPSAGRGSAEYSGATSCCIGNCRQKVDMRIPSSQPITGRTRAIGHNPHWPHPTDLEVLVVALVARGGQVQAVACTHGTRATCQTAAGVRWQRARDPRRPSCKPTYHLHIAEPSARLCPSHIGSSPKSRWR